jgi:hypothetical protein
MRKDRVIKAVAQGAHLLGYGPEDELVQGHALPGRPGFGILFELGWEIEGIPRHRDCPLILRASYGIDIT